MTRIILILCLSTSCFFAKAQGIEPKHTFNIELGLPNGFSNKPFKDIMQGLVNVSPYYQYCFENQLVIGAGIRYAYFAVNEFRVPIPVFGGMHSGGVFLKAGWEKFHGERFATDISVKLGYSQNYFITDLNDSIPTNRTQVNSTYVEPSIGFILTVDEFSSYRLIVGYAFQGFGFTPGMIGLETFGGYDPKQFNKSTSFLIIGFGYTHYFKSKN